MTKIVDKIMKWLTIILFLWKWGFFGDDYRLRTSYFEEIDMYLTQDHLGDNNMVLYFGDNKNYMGDDFITYRGHPRLENYYYLEVAINEEFNDTIHVYINDLSAYIHSNRYVFKRYQYLPGNNFESVIKNKPGKWFIFRPTQRLDGYFGFIGYYCQTNRWVEADHWAKTVMESKRTCPLEGWSNLYKAMINE